MKRTGRNRFVRNVLIAIGNSGDVAFGSEIERLLKFFALGARRRRMGIGAA